MHRYLFLFPVLIILVALSWTPGASAHPCHEGADSAQQAQMHTPATTMAAQAAALVATERHCRCCTVQCQMQCAASLATPAAFETQLFQGDPRFEPAPATARFSWRRPADRDPPRPSA